MSPVGTWLTSVFRRMSALRQKRSFAQGRLLILAAQKRERARNAQNCFLCRLFVVKTQVTESRWNVYAQILRRSFHAAKTQRNSHSSTAMAGRSRCNAKNSPVTRSIEAVGQPPANPERICITTTPGSGFLQVQCVLKPLDSISRPRIAWFLPVQEHRRWRDAWLP
jgi:hypothetical protein